MKRIVYARRHFMSSKCVKFVCSHRYNTLRVAFCRLLMYNIFRIKCVLFELDSRHSFHECEDVWPNFSFICICHTKRFKLEILRSAPFWYSNWTGTRINREKNSEDEDKVNERTIFHSRYQLRMQANCFMNLCFILSFYWMNHLCNIFNLT